MALQTIIINSQCHLNNMRYSILLLIFLFFTLHAQTEKNTKGFIETKQLFLFDTTGGGDQADNSGTTYDFNFQRNFTNVPRVGLAVYTMDFQYSPSFSCQVTSDTTITSATLFITTSNKGQNNQLYIMYIATDHQFLGIFMPGPLITYLLNPAAPGLSTQTFQFNFKEQISGNSQVSNIRVSVYLTGIVTSSQLVSNGFPTNHTYFFITPTINSPTTYSIQVSVNSDGGEITISSVQYTIIYFDTGLMLNHRYLMDKGDVSLYDYGGTAFASSKSINLSPLPNNPDYENLFIFYGISGLQCKSGPSLTLLATHKFYQSPVSNLNQVFLTMQTWKLTRMIKSQYNFIQYMSLRCGLPGANCDGSCLTSPKPHFITGGICSFCQSSCLTCDVSNSATKCDTCDTTRYLNSATGLCSCISGYYDNLQSNVCSSCFPCLTCNIKNVCLTCSPEINMVINTILNLCQCAPGFYENYVSPTSSNLNQSKPCLACPRNCLYCKNATFCLACNTLTYLTVNGTCLAICSDDQKYINSTDVCSFTSSSMFDQEGRLGYEWSYTANQSKLAILLTFSQPNPSFYYYENGEGYSNGNSGGGALSAQASSLYFDDGSNSQGYGDEGAQLAAAAGLQSLGSNAASVFNNPGLNMGYGGAGQSASAVGNLFKNGGFDDSALNGSYYGLGQPQFFKYLYMNYLITNDMSFPYNDIYGIPYGKYNVSTNPPVKNPNYIDALSKNIVFTIDNETIPLSVVPISSNQISLTAPVSKSYSGQTGSLIIKNPGLVRLGNTATQKTIVSKPIYIYNCLIPSYVSSANSIYDSNKIIVQVLWGVGKYPLFIGFGWIFMPLMLVMQFIMSLNYIDAQKPLNLQLFLASFADFRNPSIFYNPVRDSIDNSIVGGNKYYAKIVPFERFDRGIDFMANCFQFFFVPFLSVILYGILLGINSILNANKRNIPLISDYLKPRFPLHIAAYTLVQALPVSFFFFAQLFDTRYGNDGRGYLIFNTAMSYFAFFLTCSIPLMVLVHIYFVYGSKENTVKSAKDFKTMFVNLLQSNPVGHDKAALNDPLWTGDETRVVSYGFGFAVFYAAILYGFFTAFFYDSYPWQIAGLIIVTAGLLSYAAASNHFNSTIIRIFWILFSALLLAFLFLLASLASNSSSAPCDHQNIGYLGIGLLYALILLALLASILIFWFTSFGVYNNYFKDKKFIVSLQDKKSDIQQKPQRVKNFQSSTKIKSSYMKNPIHSQMAIGSKMNIGSMNMGTFRNHQQQQPKTDDRMIIRDEVIVQQDIGRRRLNFHKNKAKTGEYIFIINENGKEYIFDQNLGKRLKDKQPLYIDQNEIIYDRDNRFMGNYDSLRANNNNQVIEEQTEQIEVQQMPKFTVNQRQIIKINSNQEKLPIIQYTQSKQLDSYDAARLNRGPSVTNIYIINGQQYSKQGEDVNGMFIMRNIKTNMVRKVDGGSFQNQDQKSLSNSLQRRMNEQQLQRQNAARNQSQNVAWSQAQNIGKNQSQNALSSQISNNRVIFPKALKFVVDGQQYQTISQQGGFYKILHPKRGIQKVARDQYIQMVIKSFDSRININSIDYDVENIDSDKVSIVNRYSRQRKFITIEQFLRVKQQMNQAFRLMVGDAPQQIRYDLPKTKGNQVNNTESNSQINNILLLQSKAGRNEINTGQTTVEYTSNVGNSMNIIKQISTKNVTQIQLIKYAPSKKEVEVEIEEQEVDQQTIEYVLKKSPGPFKLFVIPKQKVNEVDGQDEYDENDAIDQKLYTGDQVQNYMNRVQKKYPNSALFMRDISNEEQYRLF